jgi:hypothetical protein
MSSIISGIDYNLLFASGSTANASLAILNAVFNNTPSSSSTFASTGDPLLDLKLAQNDQTVDVALVAKQPAVQQAITAFTNAVNQATDIKTALTNPNIQKVLLTASGLSSYIGETALVQKAFMSDPTDPKSVVNQLGDSNLLAAVQTYDFATNGLAKLKDPKILANLTNGYAEVTWRQSLDAATPGLSNALNFLSQASSIKSFGDILASTSNFYVICDHRRPRHSAEHRLPVAVGATDRDQLPRRLREVPGPQIRFQPDRPVPDQSEGEQPVEREQQSRSDDTRGAERRAPGLSRAGRTIFSSGTRSCAA